MAPLLPYIAIQITQDQKLVSELWPQPNIKQVHRQHSLSVRFAVFYFAKSSPTTEMPV